VHLPLCLSMVLSYSAAARPASDTPQTINISTPTSSHDPLPAQSSSSTLSTSTQQVPPKATSTAPPSNTQITNLILDAGPLLSLTPLRYLAQSFYTTPQVVGELRDPKVREYFKNLSLNGVDVIVRTPRAEFLAKGVLILWRAKCLAADDGISG
jgi:RNA-binding protein NOB1